MKVTLENSDVRTLLLDSFINGGLTELYHCDVKIDWDNDSNNLNYQSAKSMINKGGTVGVCQEDILIKMLEEFGIVFKDYNESFHVDGEYTSELRLTKELALENLQRALDNSADGWFLGEVKKVIPEYDNADAWTYFHILQGALYGEVVYG
jgi:hypothetical protein